MTDAELLVRFGRGEQAAFAELVNRHANWVWGCALRQVSDAATAEDITQGTFLLLSQKASRLSPNVSIQEWLFRVVGYLAKDARKLARRRAFHEARVANMKREESASAADWEAVQGVLDEAVAELRDADRQAILLRFYQGLSIASVAAAMKVTQDAAGKRVARAVSRLRESLHHRGITTTGDVEAILEGGMSCVAPAALIAQISAGRTCTGTAAAAAAKGSQLLMAAKLKTAAAVVVGTMMAGGIGAGAIAVARAAAANNAIASATATTAPAQAPEPDTPTPPIREGKQKVLVNSATLCLPPEALNDLIKASQPVLTNQNLQAYVGESRILRPLLHDAIPRSTGTQRAMQWRMDGFPFRLGEEFSIGQNHLGLEGSAAISAGNPVEIAGAYRVTGAAFLQKASYAPLQFSPGQTMLHVMPLSAAGAERRIVIAYEAIAIDVADANALTSLKNLSDWYARPQAENLRLARAGAIWQSDSPAIGSAVSTEKSVKLEGGAEVWVEGISDGEVHPIARWTSDGKPARIGSERPEPYAYLRITDPNARGIDSLAVAYSGTATVPLIRETEAGYSVSLGLGDGPYTTVDTMPPRKGARARIAECEFEVVRFDEHGDGMLSARGELPANTDADIVAVLSDGRVVPNRYRHEYFVQEGQRSRIDGAIGFQVPLQEINRLEIRTRPLKWVVLDGLAKRPTVMLPTGLEPAVDADESNRTAAQMASATPADCKAFLDKVNCVRMWTESPDGKADMWLWRDGRYRKESWHDNGHTLVLGNSVSAWDCDFATGQYTASQPRPGQDFPRPPRLWVECSPCWRSANRWAVTQLVMCPAQYGQ